ncbi:hypothetical protein [Priestia megaterium]|uniref:hypothetical protein n=1 Tax=Priestia megaterium TaxID=1404 RepID=UPI0039FD4762
MFRRPVAVAVVVFNRSVALAVVVFNRSVTLVVVVFNRLVIKEVSTRPLVFKVLRSSVTSVDELAVFNRLSVVVVEVAVVGKLCNDPIRLSNLALASLDSANIIILS